MNPEEVDYILNYHGNLMTNEESLAWRHYIYSYKLENSENKNSVEARKKVFIQKGLMTEKEQILLLLKDGINEFRIVTAKRISDNNQISFNKCPNCKKLARTPKAMQCRFCGHNWH